MTARARALVCRVATRVVVSWQGSLTCCHGCKMAVAKAGLGGVSEAAEAHPRPVIHAHATPGRMLHFFTDNAG